jgi:diguanylate cyclase (GGDEF)-like protein
VDETAHRSAKRVRIPPLARLLEPDEPELRVDLLRQASRSMLVSGLGSPPTVALIVALLWSSAQRTSLVIWAVATIVIASAQVVVDRAMLHRTEARPVDWWIRTRAWVLSIGGMSWGALGFAVRVEVGDEADLALAAVFVIAAMAANTIFSAPIRRLFLSFQVSIAAVAAIGFATSASDFGVTLSLLIVYSFGFSIVLHVVANNAAVAAIRNANRSSQLAAQLADERERIAATNLELVDVNERLSHQADHDGLTDLPNREVFRRRLDVALHHSARTGRNVAVLFFDLDRFKLVNDSLGHAEGDRLLVVVAERIRKVLRPDATLARLGGDEFTVLLPDLDRPGSARRVGESIRAALLDPVALGNRQVTVTVSVGIAVNSDRDDTADDLLRHADAAMYRAKAAGKNRVEVFADADRLALARRFDEQEELRDAIAEGRVVPWLQPEVDLVTGAIVGAEALARWVHPERGVINAGSFIHLIEEGGLDRSLANAISLGAIDAAHRLTGVAETPFRVRVNVAPWQLTELGQLDYGLEHLAKLGVDPQMLALEVTETAVIDDIDQARRWLQRAREAGITVALDDFGTGHSSLSLLAELPLDGVKIDLSFVQQMSSSPAALAVVVATVGLADVLGLDVVAEGVETAEQAALLRQIGVRRAQGYLWSPAVPVETFASWLSEGVPWGGLTIPEQESSALREERFVVAREQQRDLIAER